MALKPTPKRTPVASTATKPKETAFTSPVSRKKPAAAAPVTAAPAPKAAAALVKAAAPVAKPSTPAPKARPTGATPVADTQRITLSYFAPQAGSVLVAGDFTQWEAAPIQLAKQDGGFWKTTVELKPGKYQYRLLVDGQWQNDPKCPEQLPNAFGTVNCVLSVAA